VVVDDLSSGRTENVNPKAQLRKVDIGDFAALEKVFSEFKPEVVNHHAAQIDVRKSVADPVFDARTNIVGSLNLLELSRRSQARRFIFASSGGCVYGESQNFPLGEDEPLNPLSPYGVAKVTAETYLRTYGALFGLEHVILRYANVYGPRQNTMGEAGVIAIFIGRISDNKACTIYGDGRQTRDYVCVHDVVDANALALNGVSGVYNMGTGRETSVTSLVDILEKTVGRKVKRTFEPARTGELLRSCLDPARALRVLGWKPKVDLADGIRLTYEHFRRQTDS
jgi:UDP-glucose 4-epimerase